MQAAVIRVPNDMKGLSTTLQSLLIAVGRRIPLPYTTIMECTRLLGALVGFPLQAFFYFS